MSAPDPNIIVSSDGFDPPEFRAGGPGTSVSFQAAEQRVAFYAQEGLFYVQGKCGPTNDSTTPFYAPAEPQTLKLFVATSRPGAHGLCNSSPCSTGSTGTINVGMIVSAHPPHAGFSPNATHVDVKAHVVLQSHDSGPVSFTSDPGLFECVSHTAPVAPDVRLLRVLPNASGQYKLRVVANTRVRAGDGDINVGSVGDGCGDGDGDGD